MTRQTVMFLDLAADLCWLAQRRRPGERALPYTLPAADALGHAKRLGARGDRVADLEAWIAALGTGARWEAAA